MDFVLKHQIYEINEPCQPHVNIAKSTSDLFHYLRAYIDVMLDESSINGLRVSSTKFQIHVIFRRPCQCQCWLAYITQCVRESSFYRFKSNQLQRYGHRTWCSIVSIIRFNYISKYCVMIRPELQLPLHYSKANIEMWLWYGSQLAVTSFWSRRCVKISGSLPRLPITTVWTV